MERRFSAGESLRKNRKLELSELEAVSVSIFGSDSVTG